MDPRRTDPRLRSGPPAPRTTAAGTTGAGEVRDGRGDQQRAPSYRAALETAYALGHADDLLAADLGLVEQAAATGPWCRGRDPEDFARHLWGAGPGTPPSGIEVNAPLWYAHGFRDAVPGGRLAAHRS